MRILVFAGLILLLAGTVFLTLGKRTAAPQLMVQDKPVTDWAMDLNSPSAVTRQASLEVVRTFGTNTVPALVHLLRTPDPVLAWPVKWIGSSLPQRARGVLFRLVNPFEASAKRAASAQALRIMGSSGAPALPDLGRALRARDNLVAWHAALALAQLGEPGTEALRAALVDSSASHCQHACYALETQGAHASNAIPDLAHVLQTAPLTVAGAAARALGSMGGLAAATLTQALEHPDDQVRLLVINTLARMGPPARSAVPQLIRLSTSTSATERAAAVEAVGKIQPGAPVVITALAQSLDDPVSPVRMKALQALSQIPHKSTAALPSILARLHDDSAAIRMEAIRLLSEIGEPREVILRAVAAMETDANDTVRMAAKAAMLKLDPPAKPVLPPNP